MKPTPLLLLATLLLSGALALVACGSTSPQPDASLSGAVGNWSATSDEQPFSSMLLKVERRGGTYYLSVDGGPLREATIADGRILLPFFRAPNGQVDYSPWLELGSDGDHAAVFVRASHGKNAEPGEPTGSFWVPYPVKRLSQAAYERRATAKTDQDMYYDLMELDAALRAWAKRHDGELPATGEVSKDSDFGRWLQTEWVDVEGGTPWPSNPYTGEAMHSGSLPGDYVYERTGNSFTLTGRLHDGTVVSSTDTSLS
jgi:hypothetical protein